MIINLSLQSVVKRSIRQSKIEDEDIFFYFLKPFRASYKKNITDRKKEGRKPKKRKDKGRKKERERTLKKASTR